jgi:hypothetical protein
VNGWVIFALPDFHPKLKCIDEFQKNSPVLTFMNFRLAFFELPAYRRMNEGILITAVIIVFSLWTVQGNLIAMLRFFY